jgi:hypothetical protein
MFTIELVVIGDGSLQGPVVVERVPFSRPFFYDVEHRAKVLLRRAKRQPSRDTPDGYQILDEEGRVVARSWKAKDG